MALMDKYATLISLAKQHGVSVVEEKGVLKINGDVPSGDIKDRMWELYDQIDPNYKSNEVVLNVEVKSAEGDKVKVVTQSGNLNIRKGPGTEENLVGKASHGEILTLLRKVDAQWWYVRTKEGVEGYCYAQYLEPVN